jgi:hypothetical protein
MPKIEIKGKNLLIIVVVAVAAVLIYLNRGELFSAGDKVSPIAGKTYSAVFLVNGQVYFGILKNVNSQYLELTDVYYLRVADQQIQPKEEEGGRQTQLELVKLGNELHGPKDKMHINRDQVLFFEELKSDSRVVQTIEREKRETE